MSLEAIVWAWKQPVNDQGELLVLVALADYADPQGLCWPSHKTLMNKARIGSNNTLGKKLKALREKGLINWRRRPRVGGGSGSNVYQLSLYETANIAQSENAVSDSESANSAASESADIAVSFYSEPVSNINPSDKEPSCQTDQKSDKAYCRAEARPPITLSSAPAEENAHSEPKITEQPVNSPPDNHEAVSDIFRFWQHCLNHPHAKLDDKRRQLIRKALKTGYAVNDLKTAILGCSLTPHNMGDNDRGQRYDGLHIILRNADQIDRFIHNAMNQESMDANRQQYQQQQSNTSLLDHWDVSGSLDELWDKS